MPYTPPDFDAVNFNFPLDQAGYTAPEHDACNFNFSEVEPGGALSMALGARWAVAGGTDARSDLLAQWSAEAFAAAAPVSILADVSRIDAHVMQFGALPVNWRTIAPAVRDSRLNARFVLDAYALVISRLNARWLVDTLHVFDSRMEARWRTLASVGVSLLPARYRLNAPRDNVNGRYFAQWAIEVQPSELSLLGSRWRTIAPRSDAAALESQWSTHGLIARDALLESAWASLTPMQATSILAATYKDLLEIAGEFVIRYGDEAAAEFVLDSRGLEFIAAECVLDAGLLDTVAQSLAIPSLLGEVAQALTIDASLLGTVAQSLEVPAPLLATVAQSLAIDSEIKATTTVARALDIPSPILGASQVIAASQLFAVLDGQRIALASLDISSDEGNYAWTCEAELLDPATYSLFAYDAPFTVELGGDTYSFIVEGKRMQRTSVAGIAASISGVSPSARYARPRAKLVTKTWATAVLASEAAAELLAGAAIDWRVIDWAIPAYRLAASNEAPLEVVTRIAAAAGAVVESNPDGSLYVRYAYPAPVADYRAAEPEQSYTDIVDRFSVSEGFAASEIVNRLRILDAMPDAYADAIEWVPDRLNPATGKLRVYPSPWRETFSVEHTSLPLVSLERLGIGTEEHTETAEVLRGEGSVQYPIYELIALDWLYVNLGGITFAQDARAFRSTSTTATESLARITYRTRFIEYRAVAYEGADVQFIVREPDTV